jgi:hypothetical protein
MPVPDSEPEPEPDALQITKNPHPRHLFPDELAEALNAGNSNLKTKTQNSCPRSSSRAGSRKGHELSHCLDVSDHPMQQSNDPRCDPVGKRKQLTVNEFSVGIRGGRCSGELGFMGSVASSRSRTRHMRRSDGRSLNPCKTLNHRRFVDDLMDFGVVARALLYVEWI